MSRIWSHSNSTIAIFLFLSILSGGAGWGSVAYAILPDGINLTRIHPKLETELEVASPSQMIECIVEMRDGYPYGLMRARKLRDKMSTFRTIAERSQLSVMSMLEARRDDAQVARQYWIFNGFFLKAKPQVISDLSNRDDIFYIHNNGTVSIHAERVEDASQSSGRAVEWNVQKVSATLCWDDGFTGEGIIVGHTDTGVDAQHPSLAGKYAGHWHDAINHRQTPYDDNGHGTHTMGSIVGGDGYGSFSNDIGVAPGATYVTAKVLDSSGSGDFDQILEGLQWMADLKDTVDVKMMSASWRSTDTTNTFFWSTMETYNSIGIMPVIANGNEGPGAGTSGTPSNFSIVLSVGATNSGDAVSSFSSRGPAPNMSPWTDESNWYRPDWNLVKPDISAPGEGIRSCTPGSGYEVWNGTSMACPHVAGAVAILCQKNPLLTTDMIYNILLDTVDEPSSGSSSPVRRGSSRSR